MIDDSPDIMQTRPFHRSSSDENISADLPAPRDQSTPQQSIPIPLCPAFPAHKKITVAKHTRLVKPQPHRKPKTKQATESIPHAHHTILRFCLVPTPIATNNDPVATTAPSPSPQHDDELIPPHALTHTNALDPTSPFILHSSPSQPISYLPPSTQSLTPTNLTITYKNPHIHLPPSA